MRSYFYKISVRQIFSFTSTSSCSRSFSLPFQPLSVSVCHSLILHLSYSLYLYLCLSLSFSTSLMISLTLSATLSSTQRVHTQSLTPPPFYQRLSYNFSPALSRSLPLFLSLSLHFFPFLSLCPSHSNLTMCTLSMVSPKIAVQGVLGKRHASTHSLHPSPNHLCLYNPEQQNNKL